MEKALLARLVDAEKISQLYLNDSPLLFSAIKKAVAVRLSALNHQDLLTLKLVEGGIVRKTLLPKPNRPYAKALLAFIMNKKVDGYNVDSYLTPLITEAVEDEFIAFYAEEKRLNSVLSGIEEGLNDVRKEYELHNALYDQLDLQTALKLREQNTQASGMTRVVLSQLSTETMLGAFKQVAAILGKASYKAVIANMGKAVFSSGMVSFIKPIVLGVLAKAGLAAVAKSAVAKAFAVIIGIGSIAASVPVAYILLPVVIAFLSYEIYTLPKKLGIRLPQEISRKLEADFEEINRRITQEMVDGFLNELESKLIKEA